MFEAPVADAVRARIDWKYALSLDLTDAGFDGSVLSEFRTRLVQGNAEELLFTTLLEHVRQRKLLPAYGRQRTEDFSVQHAQLHRTIEFLRHGDGDLVDLIAVAKVRAANAGYPGA